MTMRVTQGIAILVFGLVAQNAPSSSVIAVSGAIGTIMVIGLSVAWVSVGRSAQATAVPGTTAKPGEAVQ
jgi:hypothetical protein